MSTPSFYQTDSIRIRLSVVVLAFACISLGMAGRSTWLQIIGDPKLESLGKKQFESKFLVKPRRGLITDRTGEPLAINLETTSLAGNPSKLLQNKSSLNTLAHALGVSVPTLKKSLNPKKSFTWIERHISDDRLEKFKKLDLTDGLWMIKEMKRIYPHGELAAPLIGTVNIDAEGLEGVELWKDVQLKGKSATFDAIRDALGRPARLSNTGAPDTEDGKNVELSIDASLQFGVEQVLQESIARTHSQSGLAVVMDSNTGEILALAQNPSFNPNQRGLNVLTGMNRKLKLLTDGYEPGSTLKPILLSSALSAGMKITDQLFGHFGKFVLQNKTISEAEAREKYGYIPLKKMIEVSSNIVAAELALKIGADQYLSTLRELGFGQKSGTQFPGEIPGGLPNPKQVKPLSLATMGFGQGIFVTPIQMIKAYAALSNGGYLIDPSLLKRKPNEIIRKVPVLRSQVVRDATQAMLLVTEGENGTGKNAAVAGFRIAGKTGTAQTVDPRTKRYSTNRHIASFIGFPLGTKPNFTILALLDNPKGVYFASQTAAPLFAAVLKQVVSRYSIPATEPMAHPLAQTLAQPTILPTALPTTLPTASQQNRVIAQNPLPTLKTSIINETSYEQHLQEELMPSLVGLTAQEAMGHLKAFSPQFQIHGFGLIKKQIPESGVALHSGQKVTLFLGE